MLSDDQRTPALMETGVPNLDRILGGGIQPGSIAMLVGAPGTGKTIMAEQIAFHTAAGGANVLYLTGYSETHAKLLQHSRGLRFFAPERIGEQLQFLSLPDLLQRGKAEAEGAIVAMARETRPALVVLDSFRSLRQFLGDDQGAAQFLYATGAQLALLGATTLVLLEGEPEDRSRYPELTVADVILALRRERHGSRHRRLLEVMKVRGAASLEGVHAFRIDTDGSTIYPRLEALVGEGEPAEHAERAAFDIAALDQLLGGGLTIGSSTLVAGTPGAGKTLLGLQFLAAGAAAGEPGLFLGFMERPGRLREQARRFGFDVTAGEASGLLTLRVRPSYDMEADQIADLLRREIERRGIRRLVVDAATELDRAVIDPARRPDFLAALVRYLSSQDVTTYLTMDVPTIIGSELSMAGTPLSLLAENLLLLRQIEYRGQLRRICSVLKMRFSAFDSTIHEYTISAGEGFRLVGPAPAAMGLLTGLARPFDAAP